MAIKNIAARRNRGDFHSSGFLRNSVPAKSAMVIMEFGVVTNLKILELKKDGILQNA